MYNKRAGTEALLKPLRARKEHKAELSTVETFITIECMQSDLS